ncbi:hypothetical protein D9756_009960 [Leucocoprinus leucothites]|uniref:Uncharacterized protein n=1 Tax=Leucocoprinus leucothites TaxID=201217 RepID=A0A8H5CUG0_9AGAR|nr:hypothetical protein D9756_009960 [Leucoagaricus leucothites]
MCTLTQLRIIWTNACLYYILGNGYPFPNVPLDSFSVQKLERHVCHSAKLARKWLCGDWTPTRTWSTSATANMSVTDIRFVPGSHGTLLFTLSKSIWSAITLWQLEPVISRTPDEDCAFRKRCEWSPRGAIFNGFALNSNPTSKVKLAVSSLNNGNHTIELLSLKAQENMGEWSLLPVQSIPATFKPIALEGDLLAISDDTRETIILNWNTGAYATLEHVQSDQGITQQDKCIQIVFTPQGILVVRAHSIHLFPFPILKAQEDQPLRYSPTARHSFGWVDSISIQVDYRHIELSSFQCNSNKPPPLSILVRAETDDPWASDTLSIELYTLQPNPNYTSSDPSETVTDGSVVATTNGKPMTSSPQESIPYIFPPVRTSKVISRRGSLRCADVILGRLGTALWIQPKDRSAAGLYWTTDDAPLVGPQSVVRSDHKYESLVASVFPGSLFSDDDNEPDVGVDRDHPLEPESKVIYWNERHSWSCMDYDEDVGRIVLGSGFGSITVLDL